MDIFGKICPNQHSVKQKMGFLYFLMRGVSLAAHFPWHTLLPLSDCNTCKILHNSAAMIINPFIRLILQIIQMYEYVLITWVLLSLLISFGIINRYQPLVQKLNFAMFRMTDPLLRPIRKYMPDLGSIDISPIVLILALEFIANTLVYYSLPIH